ncbi:MAG: 6-phosphofructokinase [Ruminococcaceae bacterium]|nr:6-phosphofructokinase [Oscillospiraceae bacterium]
MAILKGAALVGQSGGPTAAINATLAGVIRGAFEAKDAITKLYGMRNGIEGFLAERTIDLTATFSNEAGALDEEKLNLLAGTPAAGLGSCRKKLPDPDADPEFFAGLIALFKKYDIRYFFYIGGNDSMDTVAKLTKYLKTTDYEMRAVGVPKTIDNDLAATDHAPGYGSAAKYIASTMQEIIRDCAVYTVPAVTVVEVMGRDAGWLTASAALPRIINGTAPDYVYLPEVNFDTDAFINDIRAALDKHPNVVIAASEGIRFADGRYVGESSQSGATDVFGHKYLGGTGKTLEGIVKDTFGCKVRSIELNLPQRCAAHLQSKTDIDESRGVGRAAVGFAVEGTSGVMATIQRADGAEYKAEFVPMEIAGIANQVRSVPREYITDAGNNVTDECLNYIKPLIQGETETAFKDGLPVHIIL